MFCLVRQCCIAVIFICFILANNILCFWCRQSYSAKCSSAPYPNALTISIEVANQVVVIRPPGVKCPFSAGDMSGYSSDGDPWFHSSCAIQLHHTLQVSSLDRFCVTSSSIVFFYLRGHRPMKKKWGSIWLLTVKLNIGHSLVLDGYKGN